MEGKGASLPRWSGDRLAGVLGEAQQAPGPVGGNVADGVPEALAGPPEPSPWYGQLQDPDRLDAAAVALDPVQGRPAGLVGRVQADHFAGVKLGGIRDLEQGRNKPTWETVLALASALGVECTAFTTPPAEGEPQEPGRPPKAKEEDAEPACKRPRGHPRKDAGNQSGP
jgi:hypothetical protein